MDGALPLLVLLVVLLVVVDGLVALAAPLLRVDGKYVYGGGPAPWDGPAPSGTSKSRRCIWSGVQCKYKLTE